MDHAQKQARLLSLLRRQMNGAVAGSMREKGLRYRLNYGVSVADIKSAAAGFAPDHPFAKYIYGADIRELFLSAFLIADPLSVTADELTFWASGIITTETASNGAVWLFCKSPAAEALIAHYYGCGDPLLRYCALMTAAANITHTRGLPEWDWEKLLGQVENDLRADPSKWTGCLRDGLGALLAMLLSRIPESGPGVRALASSAGGELSQYLRGETGL
ncbi:MAG: hypothetical protein LUE10_04080 [Alistipes sp.]|nr:hypothetical protein [Alistipes sp.]